VGNADHTKTAIENANHKIHVCKKIDKINKLCEILKKIKNSSLKSPNMKVLVFVQQHQDIVDEIYSYLQDKTFPVLKTKVTDKAGINENVWHEFHAKNDFKILVTESTCQQLNQSEH
jgi:hypothetical protein